MKGLLRSLHNHRLHLRWSPSARVTTNTARMLDNSQVLRRKHPVLGIKLNPRCLLFQHVFSSYVHYAHAGVMARARILFIRPRTTPVFFVTSAQLINREFLAFPLGNFLKKSPHFLTVAVPLYCPFLLGNLFFLINFLSNVIESAKQKKLHSL